MGVIHAFSKRRSPPVGLRPTPEWSAPFAPTNCSQFLSKQIGVRSGSFQPQLILQDLVDQNPVWLNVAVTMTAPIAAKLVIAILGRQRCFFEKKVDNSFYFCEIFAPLLQSLDVLLKLAGLGEPHLSHEA